MSSESGPRNVYRAKHQFTTMSSHLGFVVLLLASMFVATTVALAENSAYKLRAGDTIEISVAGVSEMRQRFTLDLDGQISVPLVGVIKAEGSTIGQLRDQLQRTLPAKAFRTTGSDGQDIERVIEAPDIAVNIVEYSPIYINGDVVKPGQQQFRPNLTVRQVVALAGGFEVMRYHLVDPVIQSADFGAEYQTLWMEQAREQARLARLKAQLNNENQLGSGATASAPVSSQLQTDLVSNETEQLALWHADYDKEMTFLTRAIQTAADQLAELTEQQAREKEGAAADDAELQRLAAFNKQGDVTSNRVVDARRAMLLSSTRVLQTEEQIIQITREKEGYVRRIDKLKDEVRSATLKDLEESQLRLAALNVRIAATADKMLYTSTMRSQLPMSKLGGPSVTIIRGDRDNRSRVDATEDTVLEPGDVVEISVVPKTKVTEK
jgi:polysaccharide biosynthesis/export protein